MCTACARDQWIPDPAFCSLRVTTLPCVVGFTFSLELIRDTSCWKHTGLWDIVLRYAGSRYLGGG